MLRRWLFRLTCIAVACWGFDRSDRYDLEFADLTAKAYAARPAPPSSAPASKPGKPAVLSDRDKAAWQNAINLQARAQQVLSFDRRVRAVAYAAVMVLIAGELYRATNAPQRGRGGSEVHRPGF